LAGFLRHTSCDSCGSSDGKAEYNDGSSHCFVCLKTVPSEEYIEQIKEAKEQKQRGKSKPKQKEEVEKQDKTKPQVTLEQTTELKERTTLKGNNYRNIKDTTLAAFGVRTEYDETTGEVYATYYPCTEKGELVGWKPRVHPKSFGGSIGRTGNTCDLFGQFKFKNGGKFVMIVGGEIDVLSSYQMLQEYYKSKNWEYETPVVSPTIGETGCSKQVALHYEWLSSFDRILVAFDNDPAGIEATEKLVSVLPKGKVFIVKWSKKDPNDLLKAGMEKAFINDFYNAKAYVPAGVLASNELYTSILAQADVPKVSLPPFLSKLEKMIGSITLGHAYNICAWTSIGKTLVVNELVYHWIFNSPHMVGIVSMELDSGQYGETLLSRHLQIKLAKLSTEDKVKQLQSEQVITKARELFEREDGTPRFYLVDDRDGSLEHLKAVIEQMIVASGVRLIVIDPLQDVIGNLPNDEQGAFMSWVKGMIKSHNCAFILINHLRKKQEGDNSIKVSESSIMGSSVIAKSASVNIMLARDKEAEDEQERNTTYITVPKSRLTGDTGPAGKLYYDNNTHTLHDYDVYFETGEF
jgi:uncharacterized Zn finger protein (UPF0148 family)